MGKESVAPGHLSEALDRVRSGAGHGRGLVIEGPLGTDPAEVLGQIRESVRGDFGTIVSAAPAPGRLGLICDGFGGAGLIDDLRAALCADADPLALPQLYAALTRWVTDVCAAGRGPVLMLAAQAHLSDEASARVLQMLTRSPVPGLVTVLGGRRGRVIGQLAASAGTQDRITLGAETIDHIRRTQPHLSPVHAVALWHSSAGLPAFTGVLAGLDLARLRGLERCGVAELADLLDDELVRCWCGDPGQQTRLILATAAAAGSRIDVARVAEASGIAALIVQQVIGAAQEDGLLQDRSGALRFAHPLLRGACYRLVTPSVRSVIHRGLASTVTQAAAAGGDALEHIAAAGSLDTAALETLLEGCERLVLEDPGAARRIAGTLWTSHDLAAGHRSRAGLAHARALEACGELALANELAHEVMADPVARTEAALLAARCERALGRAAAAHALLHAAGAPGSAAELQIEKAAIAALDPARPPVDERVAGRAAAAVRILGAVRAERWPPDSGVREPAADAVLAAGAVLDACDQHAYALVIEHVPGLIQAMIRLGFTEAAGYQLARASTFARHRRDVSAQLHILAALLELHAGRLPTAIDHCDEALELARGLPRLRCAAAATRAVASACRSEPELPAMLKDFVADDVSDPWVRLTAQVLVEYCLLADDHPRARELLLRLGWLGSPSGDAAALEVLRALTEVQLGGLAEARDAVAAAEAAAYGLGERARVAEAAAAVALAAEQFDLAQADARVAVRLHGRAGAVVAEARARLLLAESLRGAGDLTGAEREAGLAKSTFTGMGATQLARRVVSVQKRIAATASRGLRAGEFGLSPREAEIARLVCNGLTNREIGSQLYLSVRTIDTHVARVLSKVGVGSRVALARMFADVPVPA